MTYTTLIENLKANIVRLAAEELEDNTFETAEELYDRVCENWDPVYDTLPIFYNELLDAYFDLRTDCYDEEAMECSNSIIDAVREALRRSLEDELVERREEFIESVLRNSVFNRYQSRLIQPKTAGLLTFHGLHDVFHPSHHRK